MDLTTRPMDWVQVGQFMSNKESSPILSILRHWQPAIGAVTACEPLNPKKTVHLVTTSGRQQYVLKEVEPGFFGRRLEGQFPLLLHLHACGVPVGVPIATDGVGGELSVEIDQKRYWLSTYLHCEFEEARVDWMAMYANTGAAIARLHRALASYPAPIDSWKMDLPRKILEEDIPLIMQNLSGEAQVAFARSMRRVRDRVQSDLVNLPAQHIHGDCHGGNIIFANDTVSGFIDLDHLPNGPRMYDLGYFLADMAKNRYTDAEGIATWFSGLQPFIGGYEKETALSRREKEAVPLIMLVTQILFAAYFLRAGNREGCQFNLDALYWLDQNFDRISQAMMN